MFGFLRLLHAVRSKDQGAASRPESVTMTWPLLRSTTAVTVVVQDWLERDCTTIVAPTSSEGGREMFVFLMLNELAQSGQVNAHNFQYETVALARECESFVKDSDWSRSTFSTLYRRVKEHVAGQYGRGQGLYKYQNQTLIEQLEITPDEERHMKTLISTTEKYRRRNEKDRAARGHQSKRVERAKKIVDLHRAGLSLRQIAVVVGCGRMTVARELESPLLIAIDSLTY